MPTAIGPSLLGRYPVKFAKIDNGASSGETSVVAAVTGKTIRVVSFWFISTLSNTLKWLDGSGGSELTGDAVVSANGGAAPSFEYGLFETSRNTALILNSLVATQVGGSLSYIEV